MYLTLLKLLCSSISLISGQITYPDMCWSRCGRITEVGLYYSWNTLLFSLHSGFLASFSPSVCCCWTENRNRKQNKMAPFMISSASMMNQKESEETWRTIHPEESSWIYRSAMGGVCAPLAPSSSGWKNWFHHKPHPLEITRRYAEKHSWSGDKWVCVDHAPVGVPRPSCGQCGPPSESWNPEVILFTISEDPFALFLGRCRSCEGLGGWISELLLRDHQLHSLLLCCATTGTPRDTNRSDSLRDKFSSPEDPPRQGV